jgi:hypothetical protein
MIVERTEAAAAVLEMEPEGFALVFDALGTGLWASHMLHGPRAVPPDLFAKALSLLVDGIAVRAGLTPEPQEV